MSVMSTATDDRRKEDVEFTYEDDLVTARDIETSVASSVKSKAVVLAMLAEALALHKKGRVVSEDRHS